MLPCRKGIGADDALSIFRRSSGVERLADLAEKYLDKGGTLEMSRVKATGIKSRRDSVSFAAVIGKPHMVRVAVALDDAFCFYYRENLDILEELGAEIAFFSPLSDRGLPADTDGVYLGGGYPELHAPVLEANKSLRRELRDFARSGRPSTRNAGSCILAGA